MTTRIGIDGKELAMKVSQAAQAVKSAIEFAYPKKQVKMVLSSVQGPPSKRK